MVIYRRIIQYYKRFSWKVNVVVLFVGVILLGLFRIIKAYALRIQNGYIDNAGFLELNSRVSIPHPLDSHYFASARGAYLLTNTAYDQLCGIVTTPHKFPLSFFDIHPYFISVLTSIPRQVFNLSPSMWAATCLVASVMVGFVAIGWFIFQQTNSVVATCVFLVVLLFFPVITNSILGQAYFDRFLFGPAVVLILGVYKDRFVKPQRSLFLVIAIIFLALISERGALLAGFVGSGYTLLLLRRGIFLKKNTIIIFGAGAFSFVYFLVWIKYWQAYSAYGNLSKSLISFRLHSLRQLPASDQFLTLILVVSPLLLLLLFSGRFLIIGILSFAPNVLISVGGAELNSFYTHYHQFYLPVLVAGSAIGFCNINTKIRSLNFQGFGAMLNVVFGMSAIAGSLLIWQNLSESNRIDPFVESAQRVWLPSLSSYELFVGANVKKIAIVSEFIVGLNPKTVSTPEGFTPSLFEHGIRSVTYWPVGVGTADVIIAPYVDAEPVAFPYGEYLPNGPIISTCVKAILERDYTLKGEFEAGFMQVKVFQLGSLIRPGNLGGSGIHRVSWSRIS